MSCAIICESIGEHVAEDLLCKGPKPAGAQSILIVWCDDNIDDYENPTQLLNAINSEEASLITMIRFGSDAPTPVTVDKVVPCGSAVTLYNSYPLTWIDYNYNSENAEFYNILGGGRQAKAVIAWDSQKTGFADTSRLYLSETGGITFSGGLVDPDDCDEAARFEMAGTFKGTISIMGTPAGIFSN